MEPSKDSITTYISIGNSDDKLSQQEWSDFGYELYTLLQGFPTHGEWFSASMSNHQNACWCVDIPHDARARVQDALRALAVRFRQDSIAWAEVPDTLFLRP